MRIDGLWLECDDGFVRPIVAAQILSSSGEWIAAPLLVDTGADCTVLSAAVYAILGFEGQDSRQSLGGVGGLTDSLTISTQIRLPRSDGGAANMRGEFSAFSELASLDMSVLGRDILDLFAAVVDRPGKAVSLIRDMHRYVIQPA